MMDELALALLAFDSIPLWIFITSELVLNIFYHHLSWGYKQKEALLKGDEAIAEGRLVSYVIAYSVDTQAKDHQSRLNKIK